MTFQLDPISYKVLLVDDEENIIRSIARLLMEQDLDMEILSANSGLEGLETLKAHPDVALILSDQRMPGMNGAQFLEQARELVPDAVRMVLTGYADMAATMDAINKGGTSRYLTKPWDDEVLCRTVLEGLEQYRLLQENRTLTALVEKQNLELTEWNGSLKGRVLEQTSTIRRQNEELRTRNQQINKAFRNIIVAFSRLIEQHSTRLQKHTANVTELSVRLANELKLAPEQIETIRTAALLHDVGTIGMAPELLAKPMTAMTSGELQLFLQHGVRGQIAMDEVEELREAGVLVRHHHELYGGEGAPDRLAGEGIPLGSRIIAFADFIDLELSEQRGEAAVAAVLERAKKELGQKLDPALFPLIEPHVRALYLSGAAPPSALVEKELRPKQLMEGMLVTRNLHSSSGLLILAKGTLLDSYRISTVLRHYQIDPPAGGIFVSWSPSGTESGLHNKAVSRRPAEQEDKETEAELQPGHLIEGMRISRNLYSGTGLLLLTEGTVLDDGKIVSLARYYQIDPPAGGIFVSHTRKTR